MRNKKHTRKNKITTAPVVTKDKTTTAAGQSLEANTSVQLTTDQLNHLKQLMECVNSADATRFISTLDNIKQTYPHDLVKFLRSRAFPLNSNTTETTGYPSLYLTLKSVGAIRKICISSYLLSHLVTSGAHILARAYIRPDIAAQAHEFWSVIITYAPELLTMPVYESGLMLNAAHTTHRTPLHPPLLFFIIDHTNPEANEPLERIKQELSTKLYQTYGLDAIFHLKAGIPDNRLETSTAAGSAPNDWMFNTHLTDASIRFQYAIFQQHNLLLQSVYKGTDDKHKVQCDKNFTTLNRMLDSLKKHRLFGYTADQLCEELKSTKENAYNSVSLMQDWKTVNNALNQIQWITEQFKHAEPYNQRLKQRLAEEQKTINALWNATFEIRLNYLQKNMQIECTLRQAILSRNSEIEKRDQLIRNLSSQAQSVTQLKQLYKASIKDNLQLNSAIKTSETKNKLLEQELEKRNHQQNTIARLHATNLQQEETVSALQDELSQKLTLLAKHQTESGTAEQKNIQNQSLIEEKDQTIVMLKDEIQRNKKHVIKNERAIDTQKKLTTSMQVTISRLEKELVELGHKIVNNTKQRQSTDVKTHQMQQEIQKKEQSIKELRTRALTVENQNQTIHNMLEKAEERQRKTDQQHSAAVTQLMHDTDAQKKNMQFFSSFIEQQQQIIETQSKLLLNLHQKENDNELKQMPTHQIPPQVTPHPLERNCITPINNTQLNSSLRLYEVTFDSRHRVPLQLPEQIQLPFFALTHILTNAGLAVLLTGSATPSTLNPFASRQPSDYDFYVTTLATPSGQLQQSLPQIGTWIMTIMKELQFPELEQHLGTHSSQQEISVPSPSDYFQIRYTAPGRKIDINIVNMDVSQIINSAPLTTNLCRIQSDTINMTTYRCFIYSHIAPVSWLSTRLVRVVNELWYDASTEKESFKKSLFLLKQLSLAHARIDVCLSPNTFLAFIHIINQLTLAFLNTHKNEAYYRLVAMGISDYCSTPTPYQRQRAKEIRDLIGNPETSQTIPTLQPFTLFSHAETDDQASKLAWYHKKSFFI